MPRSGLDTEAVVTAAAALADAEGLEAVTLAKVAAQLDVKSPSLYVHVDGLTGLRRQIAARGARELTDAMRSAVAGRSGRQALTALADVYRAYAREHPGTYASTQDVANLEGPEAAAAAAAALDVFYAVLRGYALADDAAIHAARAGALDAARLRLTRGRQRLRLRARPRRELRAAGGHARSRASRERQRLTRVGVERGAAARPGRRRRGAPRGRTRRA